MMGSLISIQDISSETLQQLADRGLNIKLGRVNLSDALRGKIVGLYFGRPSTRTRSSFHYAVTKMGGSSIFYSHADIQLGNGESWEDTGMMFGLYLDALVARTNGPEHELRVLAEASGIPVINALSALEHPTQAIADLITLKEEFGELNSRHLAYVGAANNTLGSLVLAASKIPEFKISVITPRGLDLDQQIQVSALENSHRFGSSVNFLNSLHELSEPLDALYTSRWESMGCEPRIEGWKTLRDQLQINDRSADRYLKSSGIFMHDLPAQPDAEVTKGILYGPRSRIKQQAFNKAISAMVVLDHLINPR